MTSKGQDIKEWLSDPENIVELLPKDIQIIELLDRGGQGVVFKGRMNGIDAAIKIYFPGQLHKRIEREVNALSLIECPTIVKLLYSGIISVGEHSLPLVATSLVPGLSLNEILNKKNLDFDQLRQLALDVALAIDEMWKLRIVHRDLKPSNIVIASDGSYCVIDLGLARHVEMSTLTAMGASWGTFGYLSPEQTKAVKQLTCKSDLYALGVVLVESSLGRHPTNLDQLRLQSLNLHQNLPDPISKWEHSQLVMDLLNPSPTKRPKPSAVIRALA